MMMQTWRTWWARWGGLGLRRRRAGAGGPRQRFRPRVEELGGRLVPTVGALLHTFHNPTPAAGDFFGTAVAVSGGRVLVGAPNNDTGALNAGSAYLYDAVTGQLLHTFHNPTPAAYDDFGT